MSILVGRVKLKNYKSIATCDLRLDEICVLVGPNGSGKSNFLDSFGFVADALRFTLDTAIQKRGGINAVRRRSGGHPNNFGMAFHVRLPDFRNGYFAFEVSALTKGFEVKKEIAHISGQDTASSFSYVAERGNLTEFSETSTKPDIRPDRLFLTSVAGLKPFDMLFDALRSIRIYDINPDEFRLPQPHDSGQELLPSGKNIASVLRNLSDTSPETFDRIREYLKRIVSGLQDVAPKSLGPTETIQFSQYVQKMKSPWTFDALNMSNGTLRALGVLTALFHQEIGDEISTPMVCVEEPEGTIHPGAAAVLMDAIAEASETRQIILTTHSPELIDHPRLTDDQLYVVASERNETRIGHADSASRRAMKNSLLTAGELLRANQLVPDYGGFSKPSQANLFSIRS